MSSLQNFFNNSVPMSTIISRDWVIFLPKCTHEEQKRHLQTGESQGPIAHFLAWNLFSEDTMHYKNYSYANGREFPRGFRESIRLENLHFHSIRKEFRENYFGKQLVQAFTSSTSLFFWVTHTFSVYIFHIIINSSSLPSSVIRFIHFGFQRKLPRRFSECIWKENLHFNRTSL